MTCCVEDAWIAALRALDCTPVKSEGHFVLQRSGSEIVPYVVVSSAISSGLRTTDTVQRIQSVSLRGYFSVDRIQDAREWQGLVEALLTCKRCVPLGDCGCFCVRSVGPSQMTPVGTLLSVFVTVTGSFMPAEETSGSGT
jgi:hypothetical protein